MAKQSVGTSSHHGEGTGTTETLIGDLSRTSACPAEYLAAVDKVAMVGEWNIVCGHSWNDEDDIRYGTVAEFCERNSPGRQEAGRPLRHQGLWRQGELHARADHGLSDHLPVILEGSRVCCRPQRLTSGVRLRVIGLSTATKGLQAGAQVTADRGVGYEEDE